MPASLPSVARIPKAEIAPVSTVEQVVWLPVARNDAVGPVPADQRVRTSRAHESVAEARALHVLDPAKQIVTLADRRPSEPNGDSPRCGNVRHGVGARSTYEDVVAGAPGARVVSTQPTDDVRCARADQDVVRAGADNRARQDGNTGPLVTSLALVLSRVDGAMPLCRFFLSALAGDAEHGSKKEERGG